MPTPSFYGYLLAATVTLGLLIGCGESTNTPDAPDTPGASPTPAATQPGGATTQPATQPAAADVADRDGFAVFISPAELHGMLADDDVIVIDVRSAEQYEAGHIPGAIHLPGKSLRTGKAKPGQGDSQYIFLDAEGQPDTARYARIFGEAGISVDATVVVYGNHAGKGDGTIPAMLLDWMGQKRVHFLDGIGINDWTEDGYPLSTEPTVRPVVTYDADPAPEFVWNLEKVVAGIGTGDAVFYDTRSPDEFAGRELRSNQRGGHIPGAVLLDYADFLDAEKKVKPRDEIAALLSERGLAREVVGDRPVVLYCQTATRVSLPYLVLKELGYPNVAVYDASWHEYGNRDDTPIDVP